MTSVENVIVAESHSILMRINNILRQPGSLTLPKIRLIARLKSDGAVFRTGRNKTNYYLKFFSKNDEEIKRFKNDIKTVYGLDAKEAEKRPGKKYQSFVKNVSVRAKLAFEDMQKYGPFDSKNWKVPDEIKFGRLNIQREFIKTFAEDDSSIIIKDKQIRIYSINRVGLSELQEMLRNFKINSKIEAGYGFKRNVFGLVIQDEYIKIFQEKIGFLSKIKNNKLKILVEKLSN